MKKTSVQRAARDFCIAADDILEYVGSDDFQKISKAHRSRIYDGAIVELYSVFEKFMLKALVGSINNDTSNLKTKTGIEFPIHLKEEICEFLVVGNGYFDFRGRSGLIEQLKHYLADDHYLVAAIKHKRHMDPLDKLVAFRNYSAHGSGQSKRRALETIGQTKMGSAGSWLKTQGRFEELVSKLKELAKDIEMRAPY